jgi:hypothetical protein
VNGIERGVAFGQIEHTFRNIAMQNRDEEDET